MDREHIRVPGSLRWIPNPLFSGNPSSSVVGEVYELDNQFAEQSAMLFGKGPSIERFLKKDWREAEGSLKVCINETVLLVPNPDFVFFVDLHQAEKVHFPPHVTIVCPPSRVDKIQHRNGNRILTFTRDRWIEPAFATAACAIATLCRWGVKRILLVGFDSFDLDEAAARAKEAYPDLVKLVEVKSRRDAYYGPINDQLRSVMAAEPQVTFDFYHRRPL